MPTYREGHSHCQCDTIGSACPDPECQQRYSQIGMRSVALYQYRFRNTNGQWSGWVDNYALYLLKEMMDADQGVKSITIEYDDGSAIQQARQNG